MRFQNLYQIDNLQYEPDEVEFDLIFCDYMYKSTNFDWAYKYWEYLKDDGIFIIMTDTSTLPDIWITLRDELNGILVNHIIYKQEWGGVPKNRFPEKHDSVLVFAKNKAYWKWDSSKILVPKKTVSSGLNPSGRTHKVPCTVWDDLGNFSTNSKERVRFKYGELAGSCVPYQKPLKFMRRLITPFVDEGYWICDPFMGSGTTGIVAKELNSNFVGIENNPAMFELSVDRLL